MLHTYSEREGGDSQWGRCETKAIYKINFSECKHHLIDIWQTIQTNSTLLFLKSLEIKDRRKNIKYDIKWIVKPSVSEIIEQIPKFFYFIELPFLVNFLFKKRVQCKHL